MSTFTYASDPLRHPWLNGVALKRKHSESSDEEDVIAHVSHAPPLSPASSFDNLNNKFQHGASVNVLPTPPPEVNEALGGPWNAWNGGLDHERKRRRCDTIEHKLARMQIAPASVTARASSMNTDDAVHKFNTYPQAPSMYQSISGTSIASTSSVGSYTGSGYPYISHSPVLSSNTILHNQYAVEEPISPVLLSNTPLSNVAGPEIQEVKMRGTEPAWYEREKDRIVITDLDEIVAEIEAEEHAAAVSAASARQRQQQGGEIFDEDEYKSEAEPHPDFAEYAECNADLSISSLLLKHLLQPPPPPIPAILQLPPGFGSAGDDGGDEEYDGTSGADASRSGNGAGGGEGAVGYGGYGDEYETASVLRDDDAMDVE